ncbi:MAG: AraC family transcriptional regulator ligand-binding domain-containing protein [Fimbriimonas sp.]|nr:AraC family transcriptional regulator ligand-binding domain-containing protein [Fimbriimonas sp.]
MGLNPDEVLRRARLPGDLFARKDASVTPSEYFDFWRALEEAGGFEEFPLAFGRVISVEAFDPTIFACFCSTNLNVALQRLSKFKRLSCPMILSVDIHPEHTATTIDCYGHEGQIPRSLAIAELVFFTQLARMATRRHIVPSNVLLTQLPERIAPHEEYFGVPLRRGIANRITFSAQDAASPFLTHNEAMWAVFEPVLRRRLSDLDQSSNVRQRVKSALLELLPSGQTSIMDAASRLAMSKRTLQRHLSAESVGYQTVLNETRQELAQHYLANSTVSLGEISYLLGFQDGNSFIRAFKSWTGISPGSFREVPRNVDRLSH